MSTGIRSAAPKACPRQLPRGGVKRVPARGGLVGFFIACPGCGFVASYLAAEGGFVEVPDPVDGTPLLIGISTPPPCMRCRRRIALTDGALEPR